MHNTLLTIRSCCLFVLGLVILESPNEIFQWDAVMHSSCDTFFLLILPMVIPAGSFNEFFPQYFLIGTTLAAGY